MNNLWILAQAGEESVEGTTISSEDVEQMTEGTIAVDGGELGEGAPKPQSQGLTSLIWMIPIFVLMYIMLFRGPKKKQRKHQQMVKSLQKNDKVQTIGGIIGTVLDVRDDEITLKIDESNNTKIKIVPSAVSNVLNKENV